MAEKYKEAGVNLEAGYESVRRIQSHVRKSKVPWIRLVLLVVCLI